MRRDARQRTAREKDALGIDRKCVDDCVVTRKVEDERPLGTFPFLDVVPACGAGCERVLGRVDGEGAYRLFVVGERDHGFSGSEIP